MPDSRMTKAIDSCASTRCCRHWCSGWQLFGWVPIVSEHQLEAEASAGFSRLAFDDEFNDSRLEQVAAQLVGS